MPAYTEESIKTVVGLEHIRFRKSQYGFTPFGKEGILLMCKEILDNALDEAGVDLRKKHEINILFLKKGSTFQMLVSDTGRGIPLGTLTKVFTKENTSGKWLDAYESSAGTNGVGAKGVVALSTFFVALTQREEGMASLIVQDAKVKHEKIDRSVHAETSGTTVLFEPDIRHMPSASTFFTPGGGYSDFVELVQFASIELPNTTFTLHVLEGHIDNEILKIKEPDVLREMLVDTQKHLDRFANVRREELQCASYVEFLLGVQHPEHLISWDSGVIERTRLKVPITVQGGLNTKTHALLGYRIQFITTNADYLQSGPKWLSSINLIRMRTKTASQITVPYACIKAKLLSFVDKKYLDYFNTTYVLPIHLISLATFQHATFQHQDKCNFKDDDFAAGLTADLNEQLNAIDDKRWKMLYEIILPDLDAKWGKKYRKDLKLHSTDRNLAFKLNKARCYYECRNTGEGTELLICEGVSSGDLVKQHRDENTQAVFELTGKLLNAFSKGDGTLEVLRKNKVISDLIQVLGTSPEDADLSQLRFEKIGILTDSDPDGSHITALILGCLYHINPKLFSEQRVFILNPPLFIVNIKKANKPIFVRDKHALEHFKSIYYESQITIRPVLNLVPLKEVHDEDFHAVVTMIRHVASRIIEVAVNRGISSDLIEMLTHCCEDIERKNSKAICKKLGYDECIFDDRMGTMMLYRDRVETVIIIRGLLPILQTQLVPIFKKFHVFDVYYEISSLHDKTVQNVGMNITGMNNMFELLDEGYRMSRMKGIGEMSEDALKETCLNRKTRSCTYVEDDNNFDEIRKLMGIDSEARKELVIEQVQ